MGVMTGNPRPSRVSGISPACYATFHGTRNQPNQAEGGASSTIAARFGRFIAPFRSSHMDSALPCVSSCLEPHRLQYISGLLRLWR
jgi:hypothetical protein